MIEFSKKIKDTELEKISFIVVFLVVTVIPLISYPRAVYLFPTSLLLCDIYDYYKLVFLFIISLLMCVLMFLKVRIDRKMLNIKVPLALFLLCVLLSSIFSTDRMISFFGFATRWQGFVSYFIYAVIFTFVVNMFNMKYLRIILTGLFISASVEAVYTLLQYYGVEPFYSLFQKAYINIDIHIIRGTMGNRNFIGSYFVLLTLTVIILFLKNKKSTTNYIYFLISSLFFAALLVTMTRVAWLGATAGMVVILWLLRRDFKLFLKKLLLLLLTFTLITCVCNYTGNNAISERYTGAIDQFKIKSKDDIEKIGSYRFYAYKRAINLALKNPYLGVGPDCLVFYLRITQEDYKKYPVLNEIGFFDKAHSEYLEFAATMGIPALIFYLLFILSIFIPSNRRVGSGSSEMAGIFAGWIGYLIQAAFNIGVISVLPIFFVYSALLVKYFQVKQETDQYEHIYSELIGK